MVKKKLARTILSEKDFSLLSFLWKFKVSTTAALSAKFYPEKTQKRAYERLLTLEKADLIAAKVNTSGKKFIWTLTKRGFFTVKAHLPPLKEDGFSSAAPGHDLLSAAALLGDWLLSSQKGVRIVTDQQLCCYEDLPISFKEPDGRFSRSTGEPHRADGYWFYPEKGVLIALEVQLSPQNKRVYEDVASFYQLQRGLINYCIWLLGRSSLLNQIDSCFREEEKKRNLYISFNDFFENGWAAKGIGTGPLAGLSLYSLISYPFSALPNEDEKTGGKPKTKAFHKLLLDVRKSPHAAKAPLFYEPLDAWI